MENELKKILEQQEFIINQQKEIFATLRRLEETQNLIQFKLQRQHDEINSRLEINERSTKQIDEQIAISNAKRENELTALKPALENLNLLESFLKVDIATRLMDKVEG